MLCKFCNGLSINHLIELAEAEFSGHTFPQQAYYQHHASYGNLVQSAKAGCSLCQLICRGFETVVIKIWPWEGLTRSQVITEEYEGQDSDIKICINADHVYSLSKIDQVELLDLILVQPGAPERIPEDKNETDTSIPPLMLTLSVPREEETRVRGYRVGRYQVDPMLGSQHNYDIAKNWLEKCCTSHDGCPNKQTSELPTRVIDVGMLNCQQAPRLVCSKATQGIYIALSHCWGGSVTPLLETNSLDRFQVGIPSSDLPANFQDAILITRQLGVQYLWIDSLCIIQDSVADWEVESKNMGAIYRDALLTISAATSRRSTDGIFRYPSYLMPAEEDKAVILNTLTDSSSYSAVKVSIKDEDEESLRALFIESPLSRRGWVLQESVLSRRILYYGSRQVYWKCPHGFQSADGMPTGNRMPEDQSYTEISKLLHSHPLNQSPSKIPDPNLILDDYYTMVTEYSSRDLSFNSDKFPAFSALAGFFHTTIGGEYLAGIWSTDFRYGLTWHNELFTCKHDLADEAPSWSWAVTSEPVTFYGLDRKEIASPHDAQLVDYTVKLRGRNPYGQVDSGQLVLKGLTKKLCRSRQVINITNPEFSTGFIHFDEVEVDETNNATNTFFTVTNETEKYFLSVIDGTGERKEWDIDFDLISENEYIVLIIDVSTEDDDTGINGRAVGLVLRRVSNVKGNVYMRAGTFNTFHRYNFDMWLETWDRIVVTIV